MLYIVRVAEDFYEGDANFILLANGSQVGGVQTVTANHSAGAWQDITLSDTLNSIPNDISVVFLNDAWGGSAAEDRNLYVDSLTVGGLVYTGNSAANGAGGLTVGDAAALDTDGALTFHPTSTLTLSVSEDAYEGDAEFVVIVDGSQIGGVQTATANHSKGQWQEITLDAPLGSDPSAVSVKFINDAWGGSPAADRNLYVQSITLNGDAYLGSSAVNDAGGYTVNGAAALDIAGSITFNVSDTLTFRVSEDSYQGDAQFTVTVDGKQVGGVQTATASHSSDAWQDVTLTGPFGGDPSQISVTFLNDLWGGSAAADRNLYVESMTLNGDAYLGSSAVNHAGGLTANGAAALDTDGSLTFENIADLPRDNDGVTFASNQYISVGDKLQYDSNQSWSVATEIDVKAPANGPSPGLPGGGAELVFGNTNGAPYQGYELWIDDKGDLRVRIMHNFLANQYIDVAGSTDVADGKMHFIGATYDGSSSAAGVTLYVDGHVDPSHVLSNTLCGSSISNGPMIIGNQLNGWQSQFELNGQMLDFVLSNVSRPVQYFQSAAADLSSPDANTQLEFRFEENCGLITKDSSGEVNNGVLSSDAIWCHTISQ